MILRGFSSTRQQRLDNDFGTIIIESILTAVHIFQSWSFPEAPELNVAWRSYLHFLRLYVAELTRPLPRKLL